MKTSDMVPVHKPDNELGNSDNELGEERNNNIEPGSTVPDNYQMVPLLGHRPPLHVIF